ncbi:hypothetical protein L6452_01509 [Arctium lappa]|uniref:Uncharacterized protein n=1 Tax=Arctium lappa TaxID=4217 RepID=A0ACB9FGA9_ARCLA|nr:hypothetical protein L6452_01509 [Arctium lappa]
METKTLPENPPPPPPAIDYSSNVDTSRTFRSVKEAVAIFGERFLTGEIFLPPPKPPFTLPKQETPPWKFAQHSPQISWKSCSSSCESQEEPSSSFLAASMKKIESELEETKKELKLLKERESETEVALASLNAELHKNMSKIAKPDQASEAEKVAASRGLDLVVSGGGGGGGRKTVERKMVKKKPIIPLLRDLFSKKKRKSNASFVNPVYTSSRMHWISKLGFR